MQHRLELLTNFFKEIKYGVMKTLINTKYHFWINKICEKTTLQLFFLRYLKQQRFSTVTKSRTWLYKCWATMERPVQPLEAYFVLLKIIKKKDQNLKNQRAKNPSDTRVSVNWLPLFDWVNYFVSLLMS